jgi:hypothetical protein
MLPRIPVAVARDIKEKLTAYDKEVAPAIPDNYSKDKNNNGKHSKYEERSSNADYRRRSRSPSRSSYSRHYERDDRRERSDRISSYNSKHDYQHRRSRDDYNHRDSYRSRKEEDYRARDRSQDRDYRRHRSRSPTYRRDHRRY